MGRRRFSTGGIQGENGRETERKAAGGTMFWDRDNHHQGHENAGEMMLFGRDGRGEKALNRSRGEAEGTVVN
jgi:hypothetical protein